MISGLALLAAVLWPARIIGPLDGMPLDGTGEALLLGVALPWLWWMEPRFVSRRSTQAVIAALLAWKILMWGGATQQGWCAQMLTPQPLASDAYRLDRSWDARVEWQQAVPTCSAVQARPYRTLADFPAWIINVPVTSERIPGSDRVRWIENARPPDGRYAMDVVGYVSAESKGELTFGIAGDAKLRASIDSASIDGAEGPHAIVVSRGLHLVTAHLDLKGSDWRFEPRWNGRDLFSTGSATVGAPTVVDAVLRRGRFVSAILVLTLLLLWARAVAIQLGITWPYLGASITFAALFLVMGWHQSVFVSRLAVASLLGAAWFVRAGRSARAGMREFVLVVGLPWLALFAGRGLDQIGRFSIYTPGDDWTLYQRYAHRIFMQGYWLEGGERTFWNQPLYRWICGALHMVYGDSSVGELYLDAFGLLIAAAFVFAVVRRLADDRLAAYAGTATLVSFAVGPTWYLIGRGLSEIVAAASVYAAALLLIRDGSGTYGRALAAGALGMLAFFTRLNLLLFVAAFCALWLPWNFSAGEWTDVRRWRTIEWRRPFVYLAVIACGVLLFATRTWYYTGHFSVFEGTPRYLLSTGLSRTTLLSVQAWKSAFESVLMIVTVQDPPRFDIRAVLTIGGMAASVLALARVPIIRQIPLSLALLCIGAVAGGFVTRGTGYPGRFSVHLIPVAVLAAFVAVDRCVSAARRATPIDGVAA